jgi:uncharacterized DUF497 family protein
MQQPTAIDVWEFEWDESNEAHCSRHGVTPMVAELVKDDRPKFFRNRPGETGTHVMIGEDDKGRFWTIILRGTGQRGRWRPITGWPSDTPEIVKYNSA